MKYKAVIISMSCFIVLVIILVNYFPDSEHEREMQKKEQFFFRSEMRGVVDETRMRSRRDYCLLESGEEFYFYWDMSRYSADTKIAGKSFTEYAEKGDSIIKLKDEDYFTLKKRSGAKFVYYISKE